ncbi:MAG: hypothetical protein V3V08_07610 [Nannocystaceae bacterium]
MPTRPRAQPRFASCAWLSIALGCGAPESKPEPRSAPVGGDARRRLSVLEAPALPQAATTRSAFAAWRRGEFVHIAGRGQDDVEGRNAWKTEFEGKAAVNAELSHPYFAMADAEGNIYIADKDAHAVRRVTPDGAMVTWLGTGAAGDGPNGPALGTTIAVASPNGLWVRADGVCYVLDRENGKIRRVDARGQASLLATIPGGIDTGRGLWVSEDESTAYFASKHELKRWTPRAVEVVADGFVSLANMTMDPDGRLVFVDRGGERVYRLDRTGTVSPLAGTGTGTATSSGGEGYAAVETTLAGPRAVVSLPGGGYVVATQRGRRLWGIASDGRLTLLFDAREGRASAGIEANAIGAIRGLSRSADGELILTHSAGGQVHLLHGAP